MSAAAAGKKAAATKKARSQDAKSTMQAAASKKSRVDSAAGLVVTVTAPAGTTPIGREAAATLLRDFVAPMSPQAFMKDVYGRKCLVVHGGGTARLMELEDAWFCGLDLRELLDETASERIFVWMRQVADGSIASVEVDTPEAALTCHGAGASLYFRSPQEASDVLVAAMSRDVGMAFGSVHASGDVKGEIEVFVSKAGHVTEGHFDFQQNWTFQLRGRKRWWLKKASAAGVTYTRMCIVVNSVRGCAGYHRAPDPWCDAALQEHRKPRGANEGPPSRGPHVQGSAGAGVLRRRRAGAAGAGQPAIPPRWRLAPSGSGGGLDIGRLDSAGIVSSLRTEKRLRCRSTSHSLARRGRTCVRTPSASCCGATTSGERYSTAAAVTASALILPRPKTRRSAWLRLRLQRCRSCGAATFFPLAPLISQARRMPRYSVAMTARRRYCAVLCCAVLCCAVLCCAVLCCAVLCCAVLCCAVLCCAVLCCAVLLIIAAMLLCCRRSRLASCA